MEYKAQAKNVKGSPRKARIVADAVRGMNALYAIEALRYMRKGAALTVRKVVESAVANATHNHGVSPESLKITRIQIDGGLVMKRQRAASRGRARLILKRNSHITVYVGTPTAKSETVQAAKAEAASSQVTSGKQDTKVESQKPKAKKSAAKPKASTAKKAATKKTTSKSKK